MTASSGERPVAQPAEEERGPEDPEVRIGRLEDELAALAREVEEIREDLRALASAVRNMGQSER